MNHPSKTFAYAAHASGAPLAPFSFERRVPGARDVALEILFCGICHSDIHQVRNEWGGGQYPMVPGHEIVGVVRQVGAEVGRFRVGDHVGVGCFVDSCRTCAGCRAGEEQFCAAGMVSTYNSPSRDGTGTTRGGFSSSIVVDQDYVLSIPKALPLERAAPLLCAGITTFSPLRQWQVRAGTRVGIMGLGGLGHMGVKLAAAMGAKVTVLSTSAGKRADALRLGAHEFIVTDAAGPPASARGQFDLILNTLSAAHDLNVYLPLLDTGGTLVLLGAPPRGPGIEPFALIGGRRRLVGSLIGGIRETQEMLNFCADQAVAADVETIGAPAINGAIERMMRGDVRYRFVIDAKTFLPSA